MEYMDLQGKWQYVLEDTPENAQKYIQGFQGGDFYLPGTTCENGIGRQQEYYEVLNKDTVRAPREKFSYLGGLWLQKEIEIPKEAENKKIRLFLERVNMASELWIDGNKIERQIVGLSTPHIYHLTGKITAGVHRFTLRIDNRNLICSDVMASGYSLDTQGYWNGIVGRIELQWEDVCGVEDVQIYPKEDGIDLRLLISSQVATPLERGHVRIGLQVITPDGEYLEEKRFDRELFMSKQVEYFTYEIPDIQWWDEFSPKLYTLHISYHLTGYTGDETGKVISEKNVRFGMRILEVKDKEFCLNQQPIALRGTTDCAIFPLTGYPAMDKADWIRKFRIIKAYGLNHVRFHAWCPPENAFVAADELGIYLAVEMPLWLNKDVCQLEVGEASVHREYFLLEAQRISKTYGNHPSFLFFTNGNENMGDMGLLEDILISTKAIDNRRLYAISSNFDHRVLPQEDFLCAYEAGGRYVRMQNLQEEAAKDTCLNYNQAVKEMPVPVISFEIGQYCSFPNVDLADKYTGNMLPVNYAVIRKVMQEKGIYHRLAEYVKASGDLVVKLYKEEIECALRTDKFGGFQLLSLSDYTGQDTAIVGLLDAFWDSKGYVAPKEFRQFCGEVVPLFLAKRIYRNTETIHAKLMLYDYGKKRIKHPLFEVKVYRGESPLKEELLWQLKTEKAEIEIPLWRLKIQKASVLRVEVGVLSADNDNKDVCSYKNSYRVFIGIEAEQDVAQTSLVCKNTNTLRKWIKEGKSGIVSAKVFKKTLECSFIPVFWSPVFFESSKPCGGMILAEHPVFTHFPTEKYMDYQWKTLLDNADSVDILAMGKELKPMVEMVPNFVDMTPSSPLFEICVENSRLLICGFDLQSTDNMTKQFAYSIKNYIDSVNFTPEYEMTEEDFVRLLCVESKDSED